MSSSPVTALTRASTRNTPPTRASLPATASDHAKDATDGQHAPCRIFAVHGWLAAQAVIVQISRSGVACLCRAGAPEGWEQAPENLACTSARSRQCLSVTGTAWCFAGQMPAVADGPGFRQPLPEQVI